MSSIEKSNYILQTDSGKRFSCLNSYFMSNSQPNSIGVTTFSEIESYTIPNIIHVRFDYSYKELIQIANQFGYTSSATAMKEFWIEAMNFCGIRLGDIESLRYVKCIKGFNEGTRYYRVAGLFDNTRVTFRVVPNIWGESDHRWKSPFVMYGNKITIEDHLVGILTAIFTASSLYNIAYATENTEGENILSINPRQYCMQHCKFCFKGIRHMCADAKAKFINLTADEIIRFLEVEYADLDYSKINELVILTARYPSTTQVISDCEKIYHGLKQISNGKFNPVQNPNQRMKISTHLLLDKNSMDSVKKVGVKRYIYPIEIFSQTYREKYMTSPYYRNGSNKGDVTMDDIYHAFSLASNVFGVDNIEPVILLGIDSIDDTLYNIKKIKNFGITRLTYNIFRVYDCDQFDMYHMDFESIIRVKKYIDTEFSKNFSQKINSRQSHYNEKYQSVLTQ